MVWYPTLSESARMPYITKRRRWLQVYIRALRQVLFVQPGLMLGNASTVTPVSSWRNIRWNR